MDYSASFQISAAGLRVEKLRVDVTALNIANMNTARSQAGTLFKPLRVATQSVAAPSFGAFFESMGGDASALAVPQAEVLAMDVAPRVIHDPGHPQADAQGDVQYPGVDHLAEMINLVSAMRSYEANLVAMNAAKTMAVKALEIGGAA